MSDGASGFDGRCDYEDGEMSCLDVLIVLAEEKKIILSSLLLFVLAGAVYCFGFMKPEYRSEVQMMINDTSMVTREHFIIQMPSSIVGGVVTSNAVLDAVIDKFSLLSDERGEITRVAARKNLLQSIDVKVSKENVITVGVQASTPQEARAIADFLYETARDTLLRIGTIATVENQDAEIGRLLREKYDYVLKGQDADSGDGRDAMLELYSIMLQYDEALKRKNKMPIIIQLLSPATTPDEKVPQGRGKILALCALLGLFCGVAAAFARYSWVHADDDERTKEKKARLKKLLSPRAA